MRSPWLSREYEKLKDIKVEKKEKNVILTNPKTKVSITLTNQEYNKYENNLFNEIEWEKLFFKGLAVDKNCNAFEINSDFDLENKKFIKSKKVESFPLKVGKEKYTILINPDLGSWMALDKDEFNKYENDLLDQSEWLSLFIRGLAETKDDMEVELDFPIPAEYPSVIVLRIVGLLKAKI